MHIVVVGGGLAGLAAAEGLSRFRIAVTLLEARRQLGGRAGSFYDAGSAEWLDHCQHVAMGCCTSFLDFCRQVGIYSYFRRDSTVHFIGPDGRRHDLQAARLPAPLHLAQWLLAVGYLSAGDKWRIARALLKLARLNPRGGQQTTIAQWLIDQRQSQNAVDRFWSPVLVSALSEDLDRISLAAARKVFVEGFMAAREAYEILVPTIPLGELYDFLVADLLGVRGAVIRRQAAVGKLRTDGERVVGVELLDGTVQPCDYLVLAVPWQRVGQLLPDHWHTLLPQLDQAAKLPSAPITSLHLWFDRPITELPHAVLIGRVAQWVFRHWGTFSQREKDGYYYQVVVSASRGLARGARREVVQLVLGELAAVWPQAGQAELRKWRMITQRDAVFSAEPGIEERRPGQRTAVANLMLAGDWTRTGWPSTMEGAVRSGYLAAEAVLEQLGTPRQLAAPPLPRGWLARWILR